jgi:phosphoglycolate phosphatase
MPPSLIVFDLDGTLIDSAADLAAAVNAMLESFGREPLSVAEVRRMIGDGVAMLVSRALAARQCEQADPARAAQIFTRHYEARATSLTRVFPGAAAALRALRAADVPLAVCTNKPARLAAAVLDGLALSGYFARVIGGDSFPFRKPDPRVLLLLLQDFAVAPQRSLLVGDSEIDAQTASSAGVPFVLMKHGYRRGPVEEMPSIAALATFDELPPLLGVPPPP